MNAPSGTQQQHLLTPGYKVHKQGKLYYSLNMARNLLEDWEQDLKPRIDNHLDSLRSSGDSSTQFILASRHPDQNRMKPSVVILCLSKHQRKVILKSFKGRDWEDRFRDKNVKLRVIIDTEFGKRAGTDRGWALPRLSGPNPEVSRVSFTIPQSHPSLCGASIRLIYPEEQEDSREAKDAGCDKSKSKKNGLATLGGIIAVDGCLYGLTIAHAFGSHSPQDSSGETTLQNVKDSDSSVDTASFSSSFEESLVDEFDSQFDAPSFIDLQLQQSSDSDFSTRDPDVSYDQEGIIVALGLGRHHDAYSFFPKTSPSHYSSLQHSDWALVQLECNFEHRNSFAKPDHEKLVDIVGVQSESMLRPGEVWIIAGRSGVQAGALSDATASVNLHKSHFTVRQVRLEHQLECGDSGGWVVQGDKLCGIIIAASGLVPWAYMLPIEHVFADILLTVGGNMITIPTKTEIRNLGRETTLGSSSRSSTSRISASETQAESSLGSSQKNFLWTPTANTSSSRMLPSQMSYALRLHEYVNSSTFHHVYPRAQFKELGNYLLGTYDVSSQGRRKILHTSVAESKNSAQSFVTLHELSAQSSTRVQGFRSAADFAIEANSRHSKSTSLLFMQGYPSPEWLNTIGEAYHVDPSVYQYHLGSLCMTDHFDRPSMPSYSKDIIRLCFTTIGRRDQSCLPSSLNQSAGLLRKVTADKMKEYHRKMRIGDGRAKLGDSIVRKFSSFDEGYFALEQNLTAWLKKRGNGWTVIVWLDIGNTLSQSPEGPWLTSGFWSLEHATQLLPTLQSCPVDLYPLSNDESDTRLDHSSKSDHLLQNASFLPIQYGKTLDVSTMASDPFYALSELFRFAADSEAQFLNFVETQLDRQQASEAIIELHSFHSTMDILGRHIQTLKENVSSIEHRGMTNWHPESVPTPQSQSMTEDLLRDFQYLLSRAHKLESTCVALRAMAENQMALDTSKRAMKDSKSLMIISQLTVIFLPITFVSSFLSMNPSMKGQELGETLVYWILISIFILAVTFSTFWFNSPRVNRYRDYIIRFWDSFWHRVRTHVVESAA